VVIDHILREGNACADVLAKLEASSNSPMVVLESSPPELSSFLGADAWGVVFIRE
ncbi:ribonuclease H, partial [Trifolium medium]|nr:ribonuclease H [Trifolium medium]